jgi:hypothetical protein
MMPRKNHPNSGTPILFHPSVDLDQVAEDILSIHSLKDEVRQLTSETNQHVLDLEKKLNWTLGVCAVSMVVNVLGVFLYVL